MTLVRYEYMVGVDVYLGMDLVVCAWVLVAVLELILVPGWLGKSCRGKTTKATFKKFRVEKMTVKNCLVEVKTG